MEYKKIREWEQLCGKYPDLSPFILLKLSMVWHGVVLSGQALERLQKPDYCFGKLEPFGISFAGRTAKKVMPGAILLRDATYVYINYGEAYEDPYKADWNPETGEFWLSENGQPIDRIDFVPRRNFLEKPPAGVRPWRLSLMCGLRR